jgi:transmembrane sensor
MKYSRIIQLLIRRFKNQLSSQETYTLDQWMEQKDNRAAMEEMEKLWKISGKYKTSYQPDVEKGLERLRSRIRADRESRAPSRMWSWLPAIAATLLLLIGGWYLMVYLPDIPSDIPVVTTGAGERQTVHLPDGSAVYLSENSRLEFPAEWSAGHAFDLSLTGEAFFEVTPRRQPGTFVVRTRETEVRVLGTAFNLRAYPEEKTTEVTVEHGRVRFKMRQMGQQLLLDEKDRGICEHGSGMLRVEDAGINPRPWASGTLQFRNTPMGEVVRDLEHYFGVRLVLENPDIRHCKFTNPAIRKADLDKVIQSIELAFGARVEHSAPDSYIVQGGSCSEG